MPGQVRTGVLIAEANQDGKVLGYAGAESVEALTGPPGRYCAVIGLASHAANRVLTTTNQQIARQAVAGQLSPIQGFEPGQDNNAAYVTCSGARYNSTAPLRALRRSAIRTSIRCVALLDVGQRPTCRPLA